jgi:hypothetical protein
MKLQVLILALTSLITLSEAQGLFAALDTVAELKVKKTWFYTRK